MSNFLPLGAAAIAALLALGGCANPPAPETEETRSRTQSILDAQYAAKGKPKPMQASEADRIHEEYLKSIGERAETDESKTQ